MRFRVVSLGLLSFGVVATVAACQLFLGLEPPERSAVPSDAGVEATVDATSPTDPCAHATVPGAPVDDDPGTKLEPMWFAVRQTFLAKDDAGLAGYDLDGVCSCFDAGPAGYDASPSCTPPFLGATNCDQAGGIDNQIVAAKGLAGSIADDLDQASRYTQYADDGSRAVLIFLQGYNGKPNDSQVTLGFAPAEGIYHQPGCGVVPDPNDAGLTGNSFQFEYPGPVPDGGRAGLEGLRADGGVVHFAGGYKPLWDGCDPWVPQPGSVARGNQPGDSPIPIRIQSAYVNNYEIIAAGQPSAVAFFGGSLIELATPITSAKLVPLEDGPDGKKRFSISRVVSAGRLALAELLPLAGPIQILGGPLCQNPTLYGQAAKKACESLDISISKSLDFRAGTVCDAFSVAAAANAVPVRVDMDVPAYVPPNDDGAKCRGVPVPKLGPNCELVP